MSNVATQQDIASLRNDLKGSFNDVTALLQTFMQQVDERFTQAEREQVKTRQEITKVLDHLDDLLQKQSISDDERIVMGHQLDRLDKWTHELADKIGHKLVA